MLGVLVEVFHLNFVAAQRRLARKGHISLVVALCAGGSVVVWSALEGRLMGAIFGRTTTIAVAAGTWPVRSVIPVAHLVHGTFIPIPGSAYGEPPTRRSACLPAQSESQAVA